MKNKRIRYVALLLIVGIMVSLLGVSLAGTDRYSDVPQSHWAYEYIEVMSKGGLMQGYGNRIFAPEEPLAISHMATIMANAKGTDVGTKDGKWYGIAIENAINDGYLPDLGAIDSGAYEEPCTRELAVYMAITGLGLSPSAVYNGKEAEDIPDYASISAKYRPAVLKAVQYGIINGMDEEGTFSPKTALTRAQISTILARAGYTTAKQRASIEEGVTNKELFVRIRDSFPGVFEEIRYDPSGGRAENPDYTNKLVAIDPKYGELTIYYDMDEEDDNLTIAAREYISRLAHDANNEDIIYAADGSVFSTSGVTHNSDGKYMPASGFSYDARKLLQEVLMCMFPEDGADAIETMKLIMVPVKESEAHTLWFADEAYSGISTSPSAVRWYEGHAVAMELEKSTGAGYSITIGSLNDKAYYDRMASAPLKGRTGYDQQIGYTYQTFIAAYELDKW